MKLQRAGHDFGLNNNKINYESTCEFNFSIYIYICIYMPLWCFWKQESGKIVVLGPPTVTIRSNFLQLSLTPMYFVPKSQWSTTFPKQRAQEKCSWKAGATTQGTLSQAQLSFQNHSWILTLQVWDKGPMSQETGISDYINETSVTLPS